jgi:indolepyruvate ferredoxin oxidoreductase alpha subunit
LIDAVVQKVRFVLVILDNRTTAMTGNQPTPATGLGVDGEALQTVDIEALVKGCGVTFVRSGDPYQLNDFIALVKEAVAVSQAGGPAVVIARHPCLLDRRQRTQLHPAMVLEVTETCDGCGFCIEHFECPALVMHADAGRDYVTIDPVLCSGCGVCVEVCPKKSIQPSKA